jgi:RHS repeat-associated protein
VTDTPATGNAVAIWRAKVEPFGKATVDEDPDGNAAPFALNVRFPGQYADAETGWYLNHFRDYDPGTGRYLEPDPLGIVGGLHLYNYVDGDPINFVDPHGLFLSTVDAWCTTHPVECAATGGAIGGAATSAGLQYAANQCVDPGEVAKDAAIGAVLGAGARFLWLARAGARASWKFGSLKTLAKWEGQMARRGWTRQQITQALTRGERLSAQNWVNKANTASRYVHPETGRSVVVDDVTKEVLHVGGDGFVY